jgi:uncharacterized phage-like protein YoqJ
MYLIGFKNFDQGTILRKSFRAKKISDKVSSSNFAQMFTQNNQYKFILGQYKQGI